LRLNTQGKDNLSNMKAIRFLLSRMPRRTRVERISPDVRFDHVVLDAREHDRSQHLKCCCHRHDDGCMCPCHQSKQDPENHVDPCNVLADSGVHGLGFDGGWELKESRGEVPIEFYEFLISGDTMTTAAGNTLTVKHDCRRDTIDFADAVGKFCADGAFRVTSDSGTSVYQRIDLPDPEALAPLEGQWSWHDKDCPSDESLLSIRGACWTLVTGQSVGFGLLHQQTSNGAVTLRTAHIQKCSKGQLKLRLQSGKTFRYSRHRQRLSTVLEENNEEITI